METFVTNNAFQYSAALDCLIAEQEFDKINLK